MPEASLGSQSVEDLAEGQLPAGVVTPGPIGVSFGGRSPWHGGALSVLVRTHTGVTLSPFLSLHHRAMLAGKWGSSKGSWRPDTFFFVVFQKVIAHFQELG